MKLAIEIFEKSPRPDDLDFRNGHAIETKSELLYEKAHVAVQDLMTFLNNLHPGQYPLCVTYFDEAHELGTRFWILLRLLNNQSVETMMWYVFMGTKSSISYFAPPPGMCESSCLARVLISFKDNSEFPAAPERNPRITRAIYCARLRPEHSYRSTGGYCHNRLSAVT